MTDTKSTQGLVAALEESARRFRSYAVMHSDKGTSDGFSKAERNSAMANQCENALAAYRANPIPAVPHDAQGEEDEAWLRRKKPQAHYSGWAEDNARIDRLLTRLRQPSIRPCYECGGTEMIGPICATCNPDLRQPSSGWRPELGDLVQISSSAPYADDWRGVALFFAGVHMAPTALGAKVNVTLSEHWPPRHNGDLTDDFPMEHIEPRVPTPPTSSDGEGA